MHVHSKNKYGRKIPFAVKKEFLLVDESVSQSQQNTGQLINIRRIDTKIAD